MKEEKKEKIKQSAKEVFTFIYKVGASEAFHFPGNLDSKLMNDFAEELIKREDGIVTIDLIVDYCVHQAYVWRETKRWAYFNIGWVFGKKSIEKYYNAKHGARYFQNSWLAENGMSRVLLKHKFSHKKTVNPLKKYIEVEYEDSTKKKLLNTIGGFALCMSLTTLHTPYSKVCQQCKYAAKCKEILKKQNTELYRLRNNNK